MMYGMSQGYMVQPAFSRNYSRLESALSGSNVAYSAAAPTERYTASFSPLIQRSYQPSEVQSLPYHRPQQSYHFGHAHAEYHFSPDNFLKPGKEGRFIGGAEEIRSDIEAAFETMFHMPFPSDIHLAVLNEQEFRKVAPHPSTVGVSFNRSKQGLVSEVFVLNSSLARVMLTLGHELGHVLTGTLDNPHDEEAKAYAFSLAWMKTIKEHDIAGLGNAIVDERPAENGLHNVAFGFVEKMLQSGKRAWEVYTHLIQRHLSVGFVAG